MNKFIFVAVVVVAWVQMAHGSCSCSMCSGGYPAPMTCSAEGCPNVEYFPLDVSAFDPYTGKMCVTNLCYLDSTSCPSYALPGPALSSSPCYCKYVGAWATRLGTPDPNNICWYNNTYTCPTGSCVVDLSNLGSSLGAYCATIGPCPSGFSSLSSLASSLGNANLDWVAGALARYVNCLNPDYQCLQAIPNYPKN